MQFSAECIFFWVVYLWLAKSAANSGKIIYYPSFHLQSIILQY